VDVASTTCGNGGKAGVCGAATMEGEGADAGDGGIIIGDEASGPSGKGSLIADAMDGSSRGVVLDSEYCGADAGADVNEASSRDALTLVDTKLMSVAADTDVADVTRANGALKLDEGGT
jgi:hypothetical protein